MSSTNHAVLYGLVARETTSQGFKGTVGTEGRVSLPLGNVAYEITIAFDGSGDVATINLDNGTATGGVTGVRATGTLNFSGLPVANETITVNAIVYTFKAAAALATEITIGADATATAANAASQITANDTAVDASNVAGLLTITAAETGEYGNSITLAEAATNVIASSATLTGGIDKVVISGAGVDVLGNAIPTCAAIHGVLVECTSGSVTAAIITIEKSTASVNNGSQIWSVAGRTDILENLTITSNAVNTTAKVTVRARD